MIKDKGGLCYEKHRKNSVFQGSTRLPIYAQ